MLNSVSLNVSGEYLFKDLTYSFLPNRWSVILGKSGVGKTTLLRIIAGLEVIGQLSGSVENSEKVSWMGQIDLLYPWLNVLDNILLPLSINRKVISSDKDIAYSLLKKVSLEDKLKSYPYELSGGQKQRVSLVRTLIADRDIVLMDEPFSSLDAINRRKCYDLFFDMLKGKKVILVTHDVFEAVRLGHDIYIMTNKVPYLEKVETIEDNIFREYDSDHTMKISRKLWNLLDDE